MLSTLKVYHGASLWYPIMLTQERGEISESKAAELLGMDIVTYRCKKDDAIKAVMHLVENLPSPFRSLMEVLDNE